MGAEAAAAALEKFARYDGGTDLSLLTGIFSSLGHEGSRCDAIVLCTDGINNLLAKQLPDLSKAATPVHIPLPASGANANLGLLRWMAFQTGGSASASLAQPDEFAALVSGAAEQTTLTRFS